MGSRLPCHGAHIWWEPEHPRSWPLCSLAPSSEYNPHQKLHQGPKREAMCAHVECCLCVLCSAVCILCVSMFCVSRARALAGLSLSPHEERAGLPLPTSGLFPLAGNLSQGSISSLLSPTVLQRWGSHGKYGCHCCLPFLWELILTCWVEASFPALTWAGTSFLRL